MSIFELAILEVKREGKLKDKKVGQLIIDRAYTIRKWIDLSKRGKQVARKRYEKVC